MSGQTVGYVPRRDNVVFARLMDAGKQLFGTITKKEKKRELALAFHQNLPA